jgi:hypothetical protein
VFPDNEDEIIARIESGEMLTAIAVSLGLDRANFNKWLQADKLRSARAHEARINASAAWDEKAEQGIAEASDPFELSRAKEMAHHYRWRASKIAPKTYGDKVAHTGADGEGPIDINVKVSFGKR